ncbi:MAG TPA: hypothetical protein VJV79_19085 [Polyangiaceae bacterium]|nr:hypothetical protein [Polyangiaceae bacterium]
MRKSNFLLGVSLFALTVTQSAGAVVEIWKVVPINDTRLYAGPYAQRFANYDWAYGHDKGECGSWTASHYNTMVGVSLVKNESCGLFGCWWLTHNPSILCSTSRLQVNQGGGVRVLADNLALSRRDTSLGDWAYGYDKMECGAREVMTGLAYRTAMCSPAINITGAKNCNVRWFWNGDNRGTTTRGDWSYGNGKGECALGEYIKGVVYGASATALLCCSPQY